MTDAETMVLASVQVFLADPKHPKPVAFGSGFTIDYQKRKFFVSVSHVTDRKGLTTFLETNIPFDPKDGPILKTVGEVCHFDLFNAKGIQTSEELEKLLKTGKPDRLDISFAELTLDEVILLQPEMDFGVFNVPFCEKLTLDMNHIAIPVQEERYGFYGKVKPQYSGNVLTMTPTLKHSLTFLRHDNDFHVFLAPEIIKKNEYAGCSGAPILDSKQRLVAVVCAVVNKRNLIYGFSIQKCKQLLDYALHTQML